jgi:hypothetical protein
MRAIPAPVAHALEVGHCGDASRWVAGWRLTITWLQSSSDTSVALTRVAGDHVVDGRTVAGAECVEAADLHSGPPICSTRERVESGQVVLFGACSLMPMALTNLPVM